MKKQKSILIALPLVLAMLFVSLAPFAVVPAKAYDSVTDTIYYFSDYYPTIDQASMAEAYPDYQLVYYHEWVTEATLEDAVLRGFPSNANIHMVIIDIKSLKPGENTLSEIFSPFLENDYETVFVTPYDRAQFNSTSVLDSVDIFFETNLTIQRYFIRWALGNMYTGNGNTLSDTTILIDGRLVDPFYNGSETLAQRYHFYRILLEELDRQHSTATNTHLLVHLGGNSFFDVSPDFLGLSYTASDITGFTDANGNCIWENICAMGFWELEDDFYQYIRTNQSSPDDMPLYTLRVDPPVYGEDGVAACMFTMDDAREMGEEDPEKPFETDALLALIASLLP